MLFTALLSKKGTTHYEQLSSARMRPGGGQLQLTCFAADGASISPERLQPRPAVRELVFIGTHLPVDDIDRRILSWRAAQMPLHAELWLLLLNESPGPEEERQAATISHAVGAASCVWTPDQVFWRLPLLHKSMSELRAYIEEEDEHLRRYYW